MATDITMSAEAKLLLLASQNIALQNDLGSPVIPNNFRWFDTQLKQGALLNGTCLVLQRISTVRNYTHLGLVNVSLIRFQLDVMDFDSEVARSVAKDVIAFMATVDLVVDDQFGSPVTIPPQFPSFLVGERHRLYPQLPNPAHVEHLDYRVYNLEAF